MGSNSAANFQLGWQDFERSLCSSLRSLRRERALLDVSLTCDDSTVPILAHRVVLASCSPLFQRILRRNTKSSNVHLRGVNKDDLEAVLDFMYDGVVNLDPDRVSDFLSAAKELEVKGLAKAKEDEGAKRKRFSNGGTRQYHKRGSDHAKKTKVKEEETEAVVEAETAAEAVVEEEGTLEREDTLEKVVVQVGDEEGVMEYAVAAEEEEQAVAEEEENEEEGVRYVDGRTVDDFIDRDGELWVCCECGAKMDRRENMRAHVESLHYSPWYNCPDCQKPFSTKVQVKRHSAKCPKASSSAAAEDETAEVPAVDKGDIS